MAKHKMGGGSHSLSFVFLLFCVTIIEEVPSPEQEFNEAKQNGQT